MFRKNDSPSQNEDIAGDGEWRWWGGKYSCIVQEHIYEISEKTPQPTVWTYLLWQFQQNQDELDENDEGHNLCEWHLQSTRP
jgi:hypothetical protein